MDREETDTVTYSKIRWRSLHINLFKLAKQIIPSETKGDLELDQSEWSAKYESDQSVTGMCFSSFTETGRAAFRLVFHARLTRGRRKNSASRFENQAHQAGMPELLHLLREVVTRGPWCAIDLRDQSLSAAPQLAAAQAVQANHMVEPNADRVAPRSFIRA
ncbi:hypothetical protein BABINDRAFT_167517 [Babjeviella inositovora NRRL Y-12698]|uniref:Uncharacterized protein n=1 Tax=Babjeviella inositovora NRRL Y-12698 TaxID=984486 RepID=A0A1E3QNE6_9ASCO|nr:uncharacterized protein BABINDRAFT_167517 [Babjeviella inositovora NRRL Y-12698]ODQ78964.1 hypothetical protein BABINDRAFT_167517 [Babjeviella inositovora NRRL Y-12698]